MPDDRLLTFYSPRHEAHAPSIEFLHGRLVPYFEVPQRMDTILTHLTGANLIDVQEPSRLITQGELSITHAPGMVSYLQKLSERVSDLIREDFQVYGMEHMLLGDEYFYESIFPTRLMRSKADSDESADERGFYIFDSTSPVGAGTWDAILHSATLAQTGAEALLAGYRRAYALCRPPGHHAGRTFAGGYCYFNNAAIAANALRGMGRVAILDVDYHHGNGTQAIFWDDPDVLFCSLHADPSVDYPHYAGYADETGGAGAESANLNVPLPHGTGEDDYLAATGDVLARVRAFQPAALVVSLGFDIYKDDPMAAFQVDVEGFRKLGAMINNAGLPTLYVQEGGYHVEDLGRLAVAFFEGVMGVESSHREENIDAASAD